MEENNVIGELFPQILDVVEVFDPYVFHDVSGCRVADCFVELSVGKYFIYKATFNFTFGEVVAGDTFYFTFHPKVNTWISNQRRLRSSSPSNDLSCNPPNYFLINAYTGLHELRNDQFFCTFIESLSKHDKYDCKKIKNIRQLSIMNRMLMKKFIASIKPKNVLMKDEDEEEEEEEENPMDELFQNTLSKIESIPFAESTTDMEKFRIILGFGEKLLVETKKSMFNFVRNVKNKGYGMHNHAIFIVSSSSDVPNQRSFNAINLKLYRVRHWEEMVEIDNLSKTWTENNADISGNIVNKLKERTIGVCGTLYKLLSILIRCDERVIDKPLKCISIIHSILGSWKKQHRFFASWFHKILVPLRCSNSVFKLLNNMFSICYATKIPENIEKSITSKRVQARIIKEGYALHWAADNLRKVAVFSAHKDAENWTTGTFWKNQSNALVGLKRLYKKDSINIDDINEYLLDDKEIIQIESEGRRYFLGEDERLKSRAEGRTPVLDSPYFHVNEPVLMKEGFTQRSIDAYYETGMNQFSFEVENSESGDICVKILEGDFQYYIVVCRKYGLSVVPSAGLLHFEMAGADVIWRMFRVCFLYVINTSHKYNCPWKYGTGKYGRFKRIIKHSYAAVQRILYHSSVKNMPMNDPTKTRSRYRDFFVELDGMKECKNQWLVYLIIFDKIVSTWLALVKFIRLNDYRNVVRLWELFSYLFWILKKWNYCHMSFEMRFRDILEDDRVKKYKEQYRLVTLKHSDAHVGGDEIEEDVNFYVKRTPYTLHGPKSFAKTAPVYATLGMNDSKQVIRYINRKKKKRRTVRKKRTTTTTTKKTKDSNAIFSSLWDQISDGGYRLNTNLVRLDTKNVAMFTQKKLRSNQNPLLLYQDYLIVRRGDPDDKVSVAYEKFETDQISHFNQHKTVFSEANYPEADDIEQLIEIFGTEYEDSLKKNDEFIPHPLDENNDYESDEEN